MVKKIIVISIIILFINIDFQMISALNENTEDYDLLIIAPREFKNLIIPLVKHKNSIGYLTKLVTTDQIYSQEKLEGRDKPEKIKYFIKKAIEKWDIEYVLLIGGMRGQSITWYIPVRYVYLKGEV